jgi:hypothetical protein
MNVHFGTNPKGGNYLCSSGYLAPPEQLLNPGVRSYRADNESCPRMLDQETTIYAWLEVYDEHGRQADIKTVAFTNTPPTPPDPATSKIVFEQVPTSLAVDQSVDINLRMTDGAGNTMTDFHGLVKITKDMGLPWSMQDAPDDTETGGRIVWFHNGVATIRALTFHQAGTVTLTATSESTSQAAASAALPKAMRVAAMALSSNGGKISGKSQPIIVSSMSGKTRAVSLNFDSMGLPELDDLKSSNVKLYLLNKDTGIKYPASNFAYAYNVERLWVKWDVPGSVTYRLIAERNGIDLNVWTIGISASSDVDTNQTLLATRAPSWRNSVKGKKAALLVHGIFGSTSDPKGNGRPGPGAIMPSYSCVEPLPINIDKPDPCNLSFYKPSSFNYSDPSRWDKIKKTLEQTGYYVVEVAYDWRALPSDAARTLEKRIYQW